MYLGSTSVRVGSRYVSTVSSVGRFVDLGSTSVRVGSRYVSNVSSVGLFVYLCIYLSLCVSIYLSVAQPLFVYPHVPVKIARLRET